MKFAMILNKPYTEGLVIAAQYLLFFILRALHMYAVYSKSFSSFCGLCSWIFIGNDERTQQSRGQCSPAVRVYEDTSHVMFPTPLLFLSQTSNSQPIREGGALS